MANVSNTPTVNAAVAAARSLPELVKTLQTVDPTLAASLTTKTLAVSKSPWVVLAAGVVGYVSSRYGLGFDETTTQLIAGGLVLVAGFIMRAISPTTIKGLFSSPTTSVALPPTSPAAPK